MNIFFKDNLPNFTKITPGGFLQYFNNRHESFQNDTVFISTNADLLTPLNFNHLRQITNVLPAIEYWLLKHKNCQRLVYATKKPKTAAIFFNLIGISDSLRERLYLAALVKSQHEANDLIPELLHTGFPNTAIWVSNPSTGLNFTRLLTLSQVRYNGLGKWKIKGVAQQIKLVCYSAPKNKKALDWAEYLKKQCKENGVDFFNIGSLKAANEASVCPSIEKKIAA